jgi:hypothetical protein
MVYSAIKSNIIDIDNRSIRAEITNKIGRKEWNKLKDLFVNWGSILADESRFVNSIEAPNCGSLKNWYYRNQSPAFDNAIRTGVRNAVRIIYTFLEGNYPGSYTLKALTI